MIKAMMRYNGQLILQEVLVEPTKQLITIGEETTPMEQLDVLPPVSGTIYGTLLNYKGELEALGSAIYESPYQQPPKAPILYIKPVNTINNHQATIPLPQEEDSLQIGAALAVVIGKKASKVSKKEVRDYILGYTVANDVSIPHSSVYRPAIKEKARDGFCPIGPWIVENEEIPNPDDLDITVHINGELKQQQTTRNLIRSVDELIAEVTSFMTLYEGDTLLIGVPENPPLARNGDVVKITIAGIGSLENQVVVTKQAVKENTI
ncbi:fumarylacetoacetate hydrolase family protein [Cytobacillus sp. FSL K6-0265]|uniref:fumarylacetoacetate hydrolase family protein n=1 Tax=Cytobacillus sp. FSL K6-0265 TaxID=2921448 RepID=UPI0030F9CCD6